MPAPLFAKVANILDFPAEEREVLRFWRGARIFEKTLSKPAPRGTFVFYEGPPTANGMPHNGHVLTRVIKDLFPRYKTMRGYERPAQGRAGTRTGFPSRSRSRKSSASTARPRSKQYGVEPFVEEVHRVGFPVHERVGRTDRARRLLGRPRRRLRHLPPSLRRERLVGARRALREGAPLPGAQGRLVVGAGRDRAQLGRGRAGVQDGRRPERVRGVPARGRGRTLSLLVWTTTPWTLAVEHVRGGSTPTSTTSLREPKTGGDYVVAKALVEALAKKLGASSPSSGR